MGPLIVSFELQYSGSFKGTKFNRRFTGCSQGGSPGGSRAVDASQSIQVPSKGTLASQGVRFKCHKVEYS